MNARMQSMHEGARLHLITCLCMHVHGWAGGRLCAVQNARMGRALQRLSAELYDKDTHFVLELVQVRLRGCEH